MTDSVVYFFMFFGAPFSLIIALGQLFQRRSAGINYIFALSFTGLAVWLLQISLYSSGIFDGWEYIYALKAAAIPVTFTVPPLMVLRYRWIISSRFQFRPLHIALFIPAFFSMLIILLPLCVPSIHVRNEYLQGKPILSASFVALPAYFKLVYSMFALSKVYLVLSMIPTLVGMAVLWRRDAAYRSMNVPRMGYLFAMLIVLSNMVSIAGDLVSMSLVRFSVIMANISMCSVYLVTQRHPDYNRLLRSETRKAQYERSRIQGLDIDRITERLRELMEEEKAYRDEELSLQDLSRELGIGPHQLSQILNERLGKNFNTYVNEYRVKEAKRLILEEPDRSILSIGFASGFNSNTTFTTVFSKLTGASPGQYRKLLGKSSPR